jgi:hypothetical protein
VSIRQNSDLTGGFPLLALVQGRDDSTPDLGPGSFQYVGSVSQISVNLFDFLQLRLRGSNGGTRMSVSLLN